MLGKIIKTANEADRDLTFEIGSNSDLILENTITNNLVWTIENFKKAKKGKLTLPTKFAYVDDLLGLNHEKRIIIRMSVNPEYIINNVEFGTSRLKDRIEAINKLADADYEIGVLIAPVIFLDNWKELYHNLIVELQEKLNAKARSNIFFEIIFMTYSYVHNAINSEAFPNSIQIYDNNKMTGRGRGKYAYKNELRSEGEEFFRSELEKYFKNNKIWYVV